MKGVRSLCARSLWTPAARRHAQRRGFRNSPPALVLKPYLLADIGEGIREVQIIQWFVKPGARVEQFQALCEVQSDKATVEITSRFDGIIKKLHYEADDMAQVGKALCDIDIQSEISEEDAKVTEAPSQEAGAEQNQQPPATPTDAAAESNQQQQSQPSPKDRSSEPNAKHERHRTLATPAVRHMCMDLKVNIADVPGTGKDGRVLKEDVQRFAAGETSASSPTSQAPPSPAPSPDTEQMAPLTPIQSQMFKTMTRSLAIPHFLYTDTVDMTALSALRAHLKAHGTRVSALAFILKAASLALAKHPALNARLDLSRGADRPQLAHRAAHNFGVAVDSPAGLVVPVVRGVQGRSALEVAAEIARLAAAARAGTLTPADFGGGTFTVSNVGSIGGGAVAPVIVEGQAAILGVGRARVVPGFGPGGAVVAREECVFSWSADHRFVDGATAARCADEVKRLVEMPQEMAVQLR